MVGVNYTSSGRLLVPCGSPTDLIGALALGLLAGAAGGSASNTQRQEENSHDQTNEQLRQWRSFILS